MKRSAGILIIYNNKVLIGHHTNSKWFNSYSIPKGGIEEGEEPIEAAIRECREEVGISIKENQLEKKAYQLEYKSKNKKKDIYKIVYYWICRINSLREIGLKEETVPKEQLQLEEMDWAGFADSEEAFKRLAPSVKPIIKHLEK
tara:strand:- start:2748 stop:3179 length:432 start_codon:yes stop_codon:yes gene_type:complete